MRQALRKRDGDRFRVIATVNRFGTKRGYMGSEETILLTGVKDAEGNVLSDHLWLARGKQWTYLKPGDQVAFDARVDTYMKGYQGHRCDVLQSRQIDYKLTRPTKVEVLQ